MSEEFGLSAAKLLDGTGGARDLDWKGVRAHRPEDGVLWIHLNRTMNQAQDWLAREADLDEVVVEALLDIGTRPRCAVIGDGLLLNLRGVDRNPGADVEDMATLRLWIEPGRVISTRRVPVTAVRHVFEDLDRGQGPEDIPALLVAIVEKTADDIEPEIIALEEAVDTLEEETFRRRDESLMERVGELRQRVNGLRRYLAPQRLALDRLAGLRLDWLRDEDTWVELRELAEQSGRFVADLESIRERALVVTDLQEHRMALRLNRVMYMLSVVASLFLPVTFIASLMGMNVGGIPGSDAPWGFVVTTGLMGAIMLVVLAVFRRLEWI